MKFFKIHRSFDLPVVNSVSGVVKKVIIIIFQYMYPTFQSFIYGLMHSSIEHTFSVWNTI